MSDSLRESALDVLRGLMNPDGDIGPLDRMAELVGRSVEQLRRYAGAVRFLRPVAQDHLVGVGEPFELAAEVDALRGLMAEHVRFRVGSEAVGEAPVVSGGAFLVAHSDAVGIHPVSHEVLGSKKRVLKRGGTTRVHVVGRGPVVLIDAEIAFGQSSLRGWRSLRDHGVEFAWLDVADELRLTQLEDAIAERGLPDGALLAHVREGMTTRQFGVDLDATLIRTLVRRMRVGGVAVVGLVSNQGQLFAACDDEDVSVVRPDDLFAKANEGWFADLEAKADALHARRDASDRFSFAFDEATRSTAVDGNACHVELDNRVAREAIVEAISEAKRAIEIQLYIVEEGRFMDLLGAHIIRAARRGVQVRLLVDALYSRDKALGMSNPMLVSLRTEPGIEVRANDPVAISDMFQVSQLKERDHRKLIIADEARAFVSGRNAGDLYYTGFDEVAITDFTPYERIPWLDAHVEVSGPLVSAIRETFEQAWAATGGTPRAPLSRPDSCGATKARLVVHHGVRDTNGMAAYETILDAATDHVLILNDFPIVSTLMKAVRRALGRGVQVSLLTGNGLPRKGDGSFFRGPIHRELFEHMTKGRLEPLMRRGLELYEYCTPEAYPLIVCAGGVVRPYVHAKLMTADGRVLSVGSANLDATASFWEREANIVVEDEATVTGVERWIYEALDRSFRIDPDDEYWQSESTRRALVSRLWPDSLYS